MTGTTDTIRTCALQVRSLVLFQLSYRRRVKLARGLGFEPRISAVRVRRLRPDLANPQLSSSKHYHKVEMVEGLEPSTARIKTGCSAN